MEQLIADLLAAARELRAAGGTQADIVAALRERVAGRPGTDATDPAALLAGVLAAFDALPDDDHSPETVATMTALADIHDAATQHAAALAAEEATRRDAADAARQRLATATTPGDGDPVTEPVPEPDTPEVTPDPPVEPTVAVEPATLVTAATVTPTPPPRVNLSRMQSSAPAPVAPAQNPTWAITAASDVPGFQAGGQVPDMRTFGQAINQRVSSLLRGSGKGRVAFGSLERRNVSNDLVLRDDDAASWRAIDYAANESRLPGGSLVAAGGWCSPSEILYDFCPGPVADGLVDLPTVTARRGGIRYPVTPGIWTYYPSVGFHGTEADAIAGVTKTCVDIPCPTWPEARLDYDGICARVPILSETAFPEHVSDAMDRFMAAHAMKLNAWTIAQMVAASTAVTIAAATPPPYGPGATTTALSVVELEIEWLRYRYRLGLNATVEMKAPHWLLPILRSDLAKRTGVDTLSVTNEELTSHFARRGARAQFVSDWQDALSTGVDGNFGGGTPPHTWPATVSVLLYPAGTFVRLTNDVITVDGLYDSTLLAANERILLFSEQGIQVAQRCYTSLLVTFPVCPTGRTATAVDVACPSA